MVKKHLNIFDQYGSHNDKWHVLVELLHFADMQSSCDIQETVVTIALTENVKTV